MNINYMSNEEIKKNPDHYEKCIICGIAVCDENMGELDTSKGICCDKIDCLKEFQEIKER